MRIEFCADCFWYASACGLTLVSIGASAAFITHGPIGLGLMNLAVSLGALTMLARAWPTFKAHFKSNKKNAQK